MNELKPCPFCGNEKATINLYKKRGTPSGDDGWNAEIRCKCHALVRFWALKKSWARQSAIEAWNSRAEQGQTAEVAELKRELERVKLERDSAVKTIFQWTGCPECKHWDGENEWCEKHDREASCGDGCNLPEWIGVKEE